MKERIHNFTPPLSYRKDVSWFIGTLTLVIYLKLVFTFGTKNLTTFSKERLERFAGC